MCVCVCVCACRRRSDDTAALGGAGYEIAAAGIVIACMILGAALLAGFIWVPDEAVAMVAIVVPILFSLPAGGLIHSIYMTLSVPFVGFAQHLNQALGG